MKLLTTSNTKTTKGEKLGYETYILHLAPANVSGYEVCPFRTKGCTASCLNTAGRGQFDMVQKARIRKTRQFHENRQEFLTVLVSDIRKAIGHANRRGLLPAIRLNGTSDILWESIPVRKGDEIHVNIFEAFPNVQFYDYTKFPIEKRNTSIPNYHLTFSRGETKANQLTALAWSKAGANVAVVFRGQFPKVYNGMPVVSGDETDVRFLDRKGAVIGLKAKGKAKQDTTGFVV